MWEADEEVIIRRARSQLAGDRRRARDHAPSCARSLVEGRGRALPEAMYRFFDIIKNRYRNVPDGRQPETLTQETAVEVT